MNWIRLTHLTSLLLLGALVVLLPACDSLSDFGNMNTDPNSTDNLSPGVQFTTLQVGSAGTRFETWRHNLIYASQIAQHMAHPGGIGAGSQNAFNDEWSGAYFVTRYHGGPNAAANTVPATVKHSVDLVNRLQDQPAQVNRLAAARIWKVLVFQRLTDTYGDIPYFEAGKGAIEENFTPAYDPQQEIYMDLHDELQAAIDQFDSSQPTYGEADLVFEGNIDQWKRFANSLQLRLAMRIKEVDPTMARDWADEAINSDAGVMQGPEDEVYIPHQAGPATTPGAGYSRNANSEVFQLGVAFNSPYLAEPFVDWMKDNNDPRLPIIGSVDGNSDPAVQEGVPPGVTGTELPDDLDPVTTYSGPSSIISDYDDPFYLQSYAEVEFMLAEAEVEWGIAPNSAEAHYNAGVRAAMNKLSRYDDSGAANIDQADIDNYLQNENPFLSSGTDAEKLEQINTQYWATVFPHGLEAWANWRVTGSPDFIAPPDEEGDTGGQIIRRLAYPQNEENLNAESYNEARSRQGISQSNRLTARVWWDTE